MRTIKYTVSYEKLISRVPGMFAYIETDEQGTTQLMSAINGEQGNYGKIIADMICPEFGEYTCSDGSVLKLTAGRHSYRTIIDLYYKAIRDKEWERYEQDIKKDDKVIYYKGEYKDPFLSFVERGIGLKYVGLSKGETSIGRCEKPQTKEYPLAPDYIYLGESQTMYNRLIKMKKQIELWESHIKSCKEDVRFYKSIKEEFELMNGDRLMVILQDLIKEAESVAEEYMCYACEYSYLIEKYDETKYYSPILNFNINLVNTIKDLGLVTPHIEEWIPGKRYYDGDVVYHVDDYGYGMAWECRIKDNNKVKNIDEYGNKYINGYYDSDTELIFFEDGKIDPDINYWFPQWLSWVDDDHKKYTPVEKRGETSVTVKGSCNSHLASLRRYDEYISGEDQIETPENYKDWLWYYRKGLIVNRETTNDEMGNLCVIYCDTVNGVDDVVYGRGIMAIGDDGQGVESDGNKVCNLAVWGDVIENIEAENDGDIGTITFTYWIGAHFKAEKDYIDDTKTKWWTVDDDGNYKYYFKNFELDTESKYGKYQGVKYIETYNYYRTDDEDDLWHLVQYGKFKDYIEGKFDKDSNDINEPEEYKIKQKYEFSTANNMYVYDVKIGSYMKKVPYLRTDYEATIDIRHVDIEDTPLIRYDYYNGVTFQPSVNKDVYIERGVTQAYEKYIKFSEIKTFEDLENYANGGFFTVSRENIDLG